MNIRIDWGKLDQLPGDRKKNFEEFCFHIARRIFGQYGTVSYFYNTPGSEFYVELNTPMKHGGVKYRVGDVIGWQAKYWQGARDEDNSPLGADHIDELVKGFKTTLRRQPNTKLWIVCTPGSFVEDQWEKLLTQLKENKSDCNFESWHRATFHGYYLDDVNTFNGIFQYYFGEYVGLQQLYEITKDVLEVLKEKFDLDLHTPTTFEDSLLVIVDNKKAKNLLQEKIDSLVSRVEEDKKESLFIEDGWLYPKLTDIFKQAYTEDFEDRYRVVEQIKAYTKDDKILENAETVRQLISEYAEKRANRVDLLNKELKDLYEKNKDLGSIDYGVNQMVERINRLESILTKGRNDDNVSVLDILNRMSIRDISVFAEAGHGKTHFACSVATSMVSRELPVILLTGSKFRYCDGCESKLIELLQLPTGSTINDTLDVLDYLGELYQCKLPIVIDGLNEAAPNEKRWREELPPLRRKIRERNNLILITTCREKTEYLNEIYGCNSINNTENPILLPGIERKNLMVAVAKYFRKYRITPNTLSAHSLFTNPLLLKIFCVTNRGRGKFDVNDHTLATCMKDYSDQLVKSIATINGKPNRLLQHKLEEALNKVAFMIWEREDRSLNFFDDFASIIGDQTEAFLNEGMCFMIDNVGGEQRIQFSYDLVAGYHIAKAFVDKYRDKDEFCQFVDDGYDRFFGENRHTLAEDIIKSLFYLVPMRYGQEWFELMPRNEIVIAAMDHLDIIAFEEKGRMAFAKLIACGLKGKDAKERMCNRLYDRTYHQCNLLHLKLFLPFFNDMNIGEMDSLWNCKFAGYGILAHTLSIFRDKYWADRYDVEDKIVLALLLCGIVDREFRNKFFEELFFMVLSDIEKGLPICGEGLKNKDPYIIEAVVSVIVGIGLRVKEKDILIQCVTYLKCYLEKSTSSPVFLLDGLETLFSYGEKCLGMTFDRSILTKNKDEEWPIIPTDEYRLYALYDYDFEKYHIRPLIEYGWRRKPVLTSEEVHGMLLKRCLDYGYDEEVYAEIQKKENEEVNYRHEYRIGYGEKLGRYATMELYGWLMLNGKMKGEYKSTYRSNILEIDPTCPKLKVMRTFVSQSLLVRDVSQLPAWSKTSDIGLMEKLFITKLPKSREDWVLMRGYLEQRIDEKYSNIYMSGISQLIPADISEKKASRMDLYEELDWHHGYFGEMGWRHLELEEEYYDDHVLPELLSRYCYSSWSRERFKYPTVYLLNQEISQAVGLELDIDSMEYLLNGEVVSVHYINETDQFFYLRKDVVDMILSKFHGKLRHHLYERRMVNEKLPDTVPTVKDRFVQKEKDVFYVVTPKPS